VVRTLSLQSSTLMLLRLASMPNIWRSVFALRPRILRLEIGVLLLLCFPVALKASGSCLRSEFTDEHKDVATLQRLEIAWSVAYRKGDTEFERCLLTPDFTEIMDSGNIAGLKDELGFAEANQGKNLPLPDLPKSTILLRANVAVAYGTSRGNDHESRYADYYLWERGAWHAYFAQQTRVQQNRASETDDYLGLKIMVGEKFGNVFSKTVSYEGGGIEEQVDRVSGSALYEVIDASPSNPKFNSTARYDGHPSRTGSVEVRDAGRTVCSLKSGKCQPYLDDSALLFDAFLWGIPPAKLEPGVSWIVVMPVAWELGPAATQTVTVMKVDPTNGAVTLKREGSGDGPFADDAKQMTVKKDGKEYTVVVTGGTAHWVGYTVFRHGLTMSDELLETRQLTVSSRDFGTATINERQFTLLNHSPAELL
jgi:hypothetical protein